CDNRWVLRRSLPGRATPGLFCALLSFLLSVFSLLQEFRALEFAVLVASAAARVRKGFPGFGNKLPVVSTGTQRQLQDAEGCGVADFAVGVRRPKWPMVLAARAHDEFANATLGVGCGVRRLQSEALVVMI